MLHGRKWLLCIAGGEKVTRETMMYDNDGHYVCRGLVQMLSDQFGPTGRVVEGGEEKPWGKFVAEELSAVLAKQPDFVEAKGRMWITTVAASHGCRVLVLPTGHPELAPPELWFASGRATVNTWLNGNRGRLWCLIRHVFTSVSVHQGTARFASCGLWWQVYLMGLTGPEATAVVNAIRGQGGEQGAVVTHRRTARTAEELPAARDHAAGGVHVPAAAAAVLPVLLALTVERMRTLWDELTRSYMSRAEQQHFWGGNRGERFRQAITSIYSQPGGPEKLSTVPPAPWRRC